MAATSHVWAPHGVFQAPGTTTWEWDTPAEGDHYYAFSVRPQQANTSVEVTREWTTTDNTLNAVQHFVVTVGPFDRGEGGGLLMFNMIKVEGA